MPLQIRPAGSVAIVALIGARCLNRKSVGQRAAAASRRSVSGAGIGLEMSGGGLLKGDFHAGQAFQFVAELAFAAIGAMRSCQSGPRSVNWALGSESRW
jgi:hypothetical protein